VLDTKHNKPTTITFIRYVTSSVVASQHTHAVDITALYSNYWKPSQEKVVNQKHLSNKFLTFLLQMPIFNFDPVNLTSPPRFNLSYDEGNLSKS